MALNEDTLVQQTTADYLRGALGWRSEYSYNTEVLGAEGSLGRASEKDVVLTRILGEKLMALNSGLPLVAYQDAMRQIETSVMEDLAVEWVLGKARVTDAPVTFAELTGFGKQG